MFSLSVWPLFIKVPVQLEVLSSGVMDLSTSAFAVIVVQIRLWLHVVDSCVSNNLCIFPRGWVLARLNIAWRRSVESTFCSHSLVFCVFFNDCIEVSLGSRSYIRRGLHHFRATATISAADFGELAQRLTTSILLHLLLRNMVVRKAVSTFYAL